MRSSRANLTSSVAILPIGAGLMALSLTSAQAQFAGPVGQDTASPYAGDIITINPNGTVGVSSTGNGPYDGADDTYIGVINNSAMSISSLNLSCTDGCFGFDGDGIDFFLGIPANAKDNSYGAYGGANGYFTNVNTTTLDSGTVSFITALSANGGTSYFSLEEAISGANQLSATVGSTATPLPSTWTMFLVGLVGVGFVAGRSKTKQSAAAIA